MNHASSSKAVLWLLLGALAAGSMAFYVFQIWSVNQPSHFNDFYAPWWAAHELLRHGRNPYSPAVAHEIQTVIYGAPAKATSADNPANIAGGFAYPPYAALLLWPTVYLPFSAAQKLHLALSLLVTLLSLSLWLRALLFRFSSVTWLTIALFLLGSVPAMQGIKLGNLSVTAAALIAAALFFLSENRSVLAGIFLALSTFKPQFSIVLIVWLAVWTASDWRHRRSLAGSFLGTMLLLVLVGEWLVRGWIGQFLSVVGAYRQYTYGHSLLDVWFTPSWGWIAASLLVLATLVIGWPHRLQPANSTRFFLVASLMLAVTLIVIPTLAPHAQLLLLPGFLCVLREQKSIFKGWTKLLLAGAWTLLAWPWIAAFGLLLASAAVPVATLIQFWALPLDSSPLLPAAVALALGCLLASVRRAAHQGHSFLAEK